jgi:hypothetical protein
MPGYEDNMQNIKIEDDFLQARNLTKALILIADSQGEQDGYLCDALYGIAYSMEAQIDAIAAKLPKKKSRSKVS